MDRLYSSQMVLEKLARQHGDLPNKWPPAVAQQLRQRHNALARSIEKHVCSLSDDCYPIGTQRPLPQHSLQNMHSTEPGLVRSTNHASSTAYLRVKAHQNWWISILLLYKLSMEHVSNGIWFHHMGALALGEIPVAPVLCGYVSKPIPLPCSGPLMHSVGHPAVTQCRSLCRLTSTNVCTVLLRPNNLWPGQDLLV